MLFFMICANIQSKFIVNEIVGTQTLKPFRIEFFQYALVNFIEINNGWAINNDGLSIF
jgi:hypothetical protein